MQTLAQNNTELSQFLSANSESSHDEEPVIFYSLYNNTQQLKQSEIVDSKVLDGTTYAVIDNNSIEKILIPIDDLKGLGLITANYSLYSTPMNGPDEVVGQFDDPIEALAALEEEERAFYGAGISLIDNKTRDTLAYKADNGKAVIMPKFQADLESAQQVQQYNDIVNQAAEKLADKGITGIIRDGNKDNGSYIGTVSVMNDKFLAIDVGRNNLVLLPKTISNSQLEVGQKVNLNFRNGVGQEVSQKLTQSREQGLSR